MVEKMRCVVFQLWYCYRIVTLHLSPEIDFHALLSITLCRLHLKSQKGLDKGVYCPQGCLVFVLMV